MILRITFAGMITAHGWFWFLNGVAAVWLVRGA